VTVVVEINTTQALHVRCSVNVVSPAQKPDTVTVNAKADHGLKINDNIDG
jgi:hypothetical protein